MDYLPLEKVTEDLLDQVKKLKSGSLTHQELEGLSDQAREVYERLVILAFQAGEKELNSAKEHTPFRIETTPQAEDEKIEESSEEQEETVLEEPEQEVEIKVEEEIAEDIKEETSAVQIEIETPETQEITEEAEVEKDEKIKQEAQKEEPKTEVATEATESLAEKFEKAPIENISKSISLNEKFQFIRVLCQNNAQKYDALIEKLRGCESENEALNLFAQLIKKPEPEQEALVYEKFEDLIRRRF